MSQTAVHGFESEIAPVRVSVVYRLGLVLVALAMLILPLIYLGLIALAIFGLYFHATESIVIFEGKGSGQGKLLIYVGPLLVGGILVLFMIKPLFAGRAKRAEPVSLDRESEPRLFAFVDRLCAVVGSAAPRRIDVDHQVNASASFRRGLASMLSNDLVLTIGLPLVGGLNLRQFTGVLAHEFGHFAQGGGMRLTYVIRSVSFWFARVVYERDAWDLKLDHWARSTDFRLGIVLHLSRLLVWVTRRILWALMMVGHAVSCFMLRHMEFDADRYEARVSGSDNFETTVVRLQELGAAHQKAQATLQASWSEGRLADDLPTLIRASAENLPGQITEAILEHIKTTRTGAFDTHPADADRIASARREDAEGVFRLQEPASTLFENFDGLCKSVTLAYYRNQLQQEIPAERLVPSATLLEVQKDIEASLDGIERYFQNALSPLTLVWVPPSAAVESAGDPRGAFRALQAARKKVEQSSAGAREIIERYRELDAGEIDAGMASNLLQANFKINHEEFQLREATTLAADHAKATLQNDRQELDRRLEPFRRSVVDRLTSAFALLTHGQVTDRVEDASALRDETAGLLSTLDGLQPFFAGLQPFRHRQASLKILLENLQGNESNGKLAARLNTLGEDQWKFLQRLHRELVGSHPFEAEGTSIGRHIVQNPPAKPDELIAIYNEGEQVVDRLYSLYFRILGKLVDTATRVELAVGLPALPNPPADE